MENLGDLEDLGARLAQLQLTIPKQVTRTLILVSRNRNEHDNHATFDAHGEHHPLGARNEHHEANAVDAVDPVMLAGLRLQVGLGEHSGAYLLDEGDEGKLILCNTLYTAARIHRLLQVPGFSVHFQGLKGHYNDLDRPVSGVASAQEPSTALIDSVRKSPPKQARPRINVAVANRIVKHQLGLKRTANK